MLSGTVDVESLRGLQRQVAQCFQTLYTRSITSRGPMPGMVRAYAVACRDLQLKSVRSFQQLVHTARAITDMMSDLELAVTEGEASLAHAFFDTVHKWLVEVRESNTEVRQGQTLSLEPPAVALSPADPRNIPTPHPPIRFFRRVQKSFLA